VVIRIGSYHQIFTDKLHMCRISAKFVPRLLADDKEENRVEISQELLASANGIENFLKNIITGDGKWVYGYEGGPKRNRNFVIKNCVFIFRCYKLNHLQSTVHLMQCTDLNVFSTF
jgi:hypothetical protein